MEISIFLKRRAGELYQVDSIERHKTEVLAYLPNAEFKIIKSSGHLIPIHEPCSWLNRLQVLRLG